MAAKISQIDIARFNKLVSIRDLLKELRVVGDLESSCYCPFHNDAMGGHKSAVLKDDGNILWCFSEKRSYKPYDALKLLGKDMSDYINYDEFKKTEAERKVEGKITDEFFELAKKGATLEDLADRLRDNYNAPSKS